MGNTHNEFLELDKEIKEFSGNIFERLIEIVLKKLYPQYSFTRTEYSHDGGKDFYAIDGETNIWAEAKCHKRHLELGRIAGTFIMAELYKINRIIIFSSSRLTSGALINLTKFTSRKGQELLIFNDSNIRTLIRSFGTIDSGEIIRLVGKSFDGDREIVNIIKDKKLNEISKRLIQLKNEKNEDIIRYENQLSLYLTLYAYLAFNLIAESVDSFDKNLEEVKIVDKQFYLQTDSVNSTKLKSEIKAFDVFSAELIIRNEDVLHGKSVKIEFEKLTTNYNAITPSLFDGELLPGQSLALTFYFKALNNCCNLSLPQPAVYIENKLIDCKMNVSMIPCRIIGEIPYFGEDSNKLSQLNQDLERDRNFASILIHGKSGVGKSRFLYEFQTACLRKGNRCFIFHGDKVNNSLLDFIRQILYSYYNISFVGQDSKIILPESMENLLVDSSIQKDIEFINKLLNCENEESIDLTVARNWFNGILKTDNTTFIIDNVQHLNKKVLNLLSKVIFDLKNCKCKSEIVFAFNTDLTVSGTPADKFFQHLKCVVKNEFNIYLQGFNEIDAVQYLKYSLDPQGVRKDLEELYKSVAIRAQNNPLFLKQIVLYLNQQKIIGFQNNTLCILNHARLIEELNSLPDTVFDIMRARFELLIKNAKNVETQIKDLFWSILIFGELPEKFIYYINKFNINALNLCRELGFIKYATNGTLIFEHQLIAKAVLLILENKTYNSHPSIVKLDLSSSTAKNFLENIQSKKHQTALFALEENYCGVLLEDLTSFLPNLSLENVTELFIQYIVDLMCKLIRKYNASIDSNLKISSIYLLIRNSQDRLGVQKTADLFVDIIEYQADNYKLNAPCAEEFIKLLKYYLYELPPAKKDKFLIKMEKIGQELLSNPADETKKDDFEVWILWAFGKNAMHLYNFAEAKIILDKAIALAKLKCNKHRLAELEIQLGYLYSYLEDKEQARIHWNEACLNFSGLNFYEKVLNYVYEGNVGLLEGDFSKSKEMCALLQSIYDSKDSYDYLKSVTNDFISNSLILEMIMIGEYSQEKIEEIITVLDCYRTLTLMYDTNAYLHALYKSLVFYKYIVENFKSFILDKDYKNYMDFIYVAAEELLRNYGWDSQNFEFFYPLFKDIAYVVGEDKMQRHYFTNLIPPERRDLFISLCSRPKQNITLAPNLRRGIFNDQDDKVNLFHYTYRW